MKRQTEARKKRGRPTKSFECTLMDTVGLSITTLSAAELAERLNKDGAFKIKTPSGAIHQWWLKKYNAALDAGSSDKAARGIATAAAAQQFNKSPERVQQINKECNAFAVAITEWIRREVQPQVDNLDAIREPVKLAKQLLQASYQDLIGSASLDLQSFSRREASRPDSLQRLASVLAAAFLREREARIAAEERARQADQRAEKAEKSLKVSLQKKVISQEVPGYTDRR